MSRRDALLNCHKSQSSEYSFHQVAVLSKLMLPRTQRRMVELKNNGIDGGNLREAQKCHSHRRSTHVSVMSLPWEACSKLRATEVSQQVGMSLHHTTT